jgi:DNA replication protein DnaC
MPREGRREEVDLWVLDDLGAEKPTEDVVRILTELIAAREGSPTVVTSNFEPRALLDRYPGFDRVVSRLGRQDFRTVALTGRDRRLERRSEG